MRNNSYQTSRYDSSLQVDTSSNDKVVLETTAWDGKTKMSVTLDVESAKHLVGELNAWLAQVKDVEYASANQRFSWFNLRSED